MTVLNWTANAKFVLRLIKHHAANPSRQWANSYEFVSNGAGGVSDVQGAITSFLLFEQTMCSEAIVFDRGIFSTWSPDSKPYNPDNFYVQELDAHGNRTPPGEFEPITVCWSIARRPTSGRLGHIFMRGVLAQDDTVAPSGILVFRDPAAMTTLLTSAITASTISAYLGEDGGAPLSLAMINKTGTNTRLVMDLVSSGVVQLPVDHAWFNRTTSP